MINSIQHFQEKGVKNLTEIFSHYTDDLTKFAEMVYGVTKEVTKLGLSLIEEELESYDELLRNRQDLRKGWYIERRDETKLLTSLGEICYSRTYFHNKETGELRWSSIFVTFSLKKIIDWNISFQTVSCIHLMNVDVYDCNSHIHNPTCFHLTLDLFQTDSVV